jgi:hypothetical protein
MVPERTFERERLLGVSIALDHYLRLRGNFEVVGETLDELHRLLAQEPREDELADTGRERRRGRVDRRRISTQGYRHGELLAELLCRLEVGRAGLVALPV